MLGICLFKEAQQSYEANEWFPYTELELKSSQSL
jgi:hypothetical protein